jgi:hypothetical protein
MHLLRGPLVLLLGAPLFFPGAAPSARGGEVRLQLGLWYTVWWTADDRYRHWVNCHRFPARGRYDAGDPGVIADHHAQFRDLGVDFLILDDTNGRDNDGGRIQQNIRAWFDFMDARPAAERIPLAIGGGGEMRAGGAAAQKQAADFYWESWARRPSYFLLDGKPLLLVDTDKDHGPGDFDDPRFSVRWAYNGDNHQAMLERRTWGWGAYEPSPLLEECMSIWPGHRFPGRVAREGLDPVEAPREGGDLYVRMWLRVLEARPRFVTIADWNNFEEESAIEDSFAWEDRRGHAVPDLYRRITRACSRLRAETLVPGECYRDAGRPELFLFDGKRLAPRAEPPRRAAVIVAPAGMLERIGRRLEAKDPGGSPGGPR